MVRFSSSRGWQRLGSVARPSNVVVLKAKADAEHFCGRILLPVHGASILHTHHARCLLLPHEGKATYGRCCPPPQPGAHSKGHRPTPARRGPGRCGGGRRSRAAAAAGPRGGRAGASASGWWTAWTAPGRRPGRRGQGGPCPAATPPGNGGRFTWPQCTANKGRTPARVAVASADGPGWWQSTQHSTLKEHFFFWIYSANPTQTQTKAKGRRSRPT